MCAMTQQDALDACEAIVAHNTPEEARRLLRKFMEAVRGTGHSLTVRHIWYKYWPTDPERP